MLKPTVRNLYQFMSVQAELHNPRVARYYSYNPRCKFLLVKNEANIFEVKQLPNISYELTIMKSCIVQAYATIPQFDETRVYRRSLLIPDCFTCS